MLHWFLSLLVALASLIAVPAQAAVTITFWSHELGTSFPHAFVTLRGVPDEGGAAVDTAYGFTATLVTPAILFGSTSGMIETPHQAYINDSTAQFSLPLTDAQYREELVLVERWNTKPGSRYNLNKRNCVHFAAEAARVAGLVGLDHPDLMKKPRSYLAAVAAANAGRVALIGMKGSAYVASLPPLPQVLPPVLSPIPSTPPPVLPGPTPLPSLPPSMPAPVQPAGTTSMTSSVEANEG